VPPPPVALYRTLLPADYYSLERARRHFRLGGPAHQLGGLINVGYSCYVNAVVQCLAYSPGFPQFCLSLPNVLYQDNADSAFFLDSLAHLFADLHSRRSVTPAWILTDSQILGDRFRGPLQQDAHEFLLALLDQCDTECANASPSAPPTMIGRFFAGEVIVKLSCAQCGFEVSTRNPYFDIGVPMREATDLAAALEAITKPQEVAVQGQCECCGATDCLTRASQYTAFPLILIVTLIRFDNQLRKIEDFFEFPKMLELGGGLAYELYAMVLHAGKLMRRGHFSAIVRDENDVWYRADDVCIFKMKEEAVMRSCPYFLFYKRVIQE
jgi:ubiquitin carboxyl-terminal hydrolase 36/42